MSVEELIIVVLLGIDVANVAMIGYIFRWARKAVQNIGQATIGIIRRELSPDETGHNYALDNVARSVLSGMESQLDSVADKVMRGVQGHLLTLIRKSGKITEENRPPTVDEPQEIEETVEKEPKFTDMVASRLGIPVPPGANEIIKAIEKDPKGAIGSFLLSQLQKGKQDGEKAYTNERW